MLKTIYKKYWMPFFVLLIVVFSFYYWSAVPEKKGFFFHDKQYGHYNNLTFAFLNWRLDVPMNIPQEFSSLPNPYDPAQNKYFRWHGFQDYSYYKNKIYVYYGVSPVLFLYLPFRLITGLFIPDNFAIFFFSICSFLTSFFILMLLREKYFNSVPVSIFHFLLFVLSVSNIAPFLLRCGAVYEVAISSASFFMLFSILMFFLAFQEDKVKQDLILLGSIFLGLAVCARFYYIFSSVLVLSLILQRIKKANDQSSEQLLIKNLINPFIIMVTILFLYNYVRFDNFFDNGNRYGLNGFLPKLFYPQALFSNFYDYFLKPPVLGHQFPFIFMDYWHPGFYMYENLERIVGLFYIFPLVIILIPFFIMKEKYFNESFPLFEFKLLFCICFVNLVLLLLFQYVTMRYVGDFIGFLILSTYIVFLHLYNFYQKNSKLRLALTTALIICGMTGVILGLAFSITGLNHGLQHQNPEEYAKLEKAFSPIQKVVSVYLLSKTNSP